jgi:hypothetical protein
VDDVIRFIREEKIWLNEKYNYYTSELLPRHKLPIKSGLKTYGSQMYGKWSRYPEVHEDSLPIKSLLFFLKPTVETNDIFAHYEAQ